jgi:5-(carboxyamino)imidazole ribonucleotide synthase
MTALAAAKLGYHCHIFCPDSGEPAVEVSAFHTRAAFDNANALRIFAKSVDVVTLEWENVPLQALEVIQQHVGVHPGAAVLRVAQDREQEKTFARSIGIGTTDFAIVSSVEELEQALKNFKLPAILKSTRMGYDGKGQVSLTANSNLEDAWREMGGATGIVEAFVDFACEVSVVIAARADGATAAYPVVENIHRNHILAETHAPANIDAKAAAEAEHAALMLASSLGVVGLLAVEFFVLREPDAEGRRVLMNEIAPRPHNSGHWTMDACSVSQFEQLVRAICGLPLGDTKPHSRAVMHNLLGDEVNRWPQLLQQPGASLHLYGKKEARAGRKMGHVNVVKGAW